MASIGGSPVTTWQGDLFEAQRRVGTIEADAGVDGVGVVASGYAPIESEIVTTVTETDEAAALARENGYRLTEGGQYTVVDQRGKTWLNVTILGVRVRRVSTLSGVRVLGQWRMLPLTNRPVP